MKRIMGSVLAVAVSAALLAPGTAWANEGDVIKTGSCTGGSDWKLKLSPENGRIEVEFEVDSNVVGQPWRVRLFHNGTRIFRGERVTKAPSGSFEVRRVVDDTSGTDSVRGRARNPNTDEVCVGRATM